MKKTLAFLSVLAVGLLAFAGVSHAAAAAAPEDGSVLDLLRPVMDAFRTGHYWAAGAFALVLAVGLAKKYLPGAAGAFVHSDAGGALTTLLAAFAASIGAATATGDGVTWALLRNAGGLAFAAAGSYAVIKKLLVQPLLASAWWTSKAPAWLKAAASVVLWVFDKPDAGGDATKAGDAAVAAHPPTGADGVVGKSEDL